LRRKRQNEYGIFLRWEANKFLSAKEYVLSKFETYGKELVIKEVLKDAGNRKVRKSD